VHQHDWDVVLNRIHTAALATLQAFPVRAENHRLLANRADQRVKQILGNHSQISVMLHAAARESSKATSLQPGAQGNTGESDAIESAFNLQHAAARGGMAARILDGTKLAGEIRAEVAAQAKVLALSGV